MRNLNKLQLINTIVPMLICDHSNIVIQDVKFVYSGERASEPSASRGEGQNKRETLKQATR